MAKWAREIAGKTAALTFWAQPERSGMSEIGWSHKASLQGLVALEETRAYDATKGYPIRSGCSTTVRHADRRTTSETI